MHGVLLVLAHMASCRKGPSQSVFYGGNKLKALKLRLDHPCMRIALKVEI